MGKTHRLLSPHPSPHLSACVPITGTLTACLLLGVLCVAPRAYSHIADEHMIVNEVFCRYQMKLMKKLTDVFILARCKHRTERFE